MSSCQSSSLVAHRGFEVVYAASEHEGLRPLNKTLSHPSGKDPAENDQSMDPPWYLIPKKRFIRFLFLSLFGVHVRPDTSFSLQQTTMTEGHSEQAVQQHPTMMLLICYGPVGLDLILPCCLYWDCVVFMKLWEINLFWFDLIWPIRPVCANKKVSLIS